MQKYVTSLVSVMEDNKREAGWERPFCQPINSLPYPYVFLHISATRRMPYNLSFRILFRVEEATITNYAKKTGDNWDRPGKTGTYSHSRHRKNIY